MFDPLSFAELRAANVARCDSGSFGNHTLASWNVLEWAGAMCGEAGESANVAKKIRRGDYSHDSSDYNAKEDLAKELADVVTYADLCAARMGIDLGAAVRAKWNEVSERVGYEGRL